MKFAQTREPSQIKEREIEMVSNLEHSCTNESESGQISFNYRKIFVTTIHFRLDIGRVETKKKREYSQV